ncbi:MAG: DNA-binding response regulator [Candidatus Melainabacteria bacterium HGW-Melainabacteria-1]|nr:MAG: DNA-binding response regulator [Candidatus Melainabacteria bacterium HGW-Melainabacteria-1]
MRVLLIEDDEVLCAQLRPKLEAAGYAVDLTGLGLDGQFLGDQEDYDLVILDLGLPDGDGLDVLRHWRRRGRQMPVLVLTGREAWQQKVEGFQAGADDYLAKPFHSEELLARMQALIRRRYGQAPSSLRWGDLALDEARQCVSGPFGEQALTGHEFRLLRYLMLNPGRVLSKSQLTEHVYDLEAGSDSNTLEVFIARLRHKIGRELIQTRRGQGYVFGGGP